MMRPDTDAARVRRHAPSRAQQARARKQICPGASRAFRLLAMHNHTAIEVVRLARRSLNLVQSGERRRHVNRRELPKLASDGVVAFHKRRVRPKIEERPANRCRLDGDRPPRPAPLALLAPLECAIDEDGGWLAAHRSFKEVPLPA